MSEIIYKQIDKPLKERIVSIFGDWITEHGCLLIEEEGSYAVAALSGDDIAGFAGINKAELAAPLNGCYDAFINIVEVDDNFQRQGIGRRMISMLEDWAKSYGYKQIRAWSSEDKVAAIRMWYALNYGMCPAVDHGIKGYVYAKVLNPT